MSGATWKRIGAVAWSVALWPVLSVSVSAQDAGVVRISDSPKGGGVQTAGYRKAGWSDGYGGYDCPECRGGRACPHCFGAGCHHCGHHGCFGCLAGKFQEHYCTYSPDYGFSIPGKYPIHRRGVQYSQYFPAAWYGANGSLGVDAVFPMVYQPTDTAQLGFYYQHVPFWMPQPNPLPPRPVPAQWHHYAPAVGASAYHASGFGGACPVVVSEAVAPSPTPAQLQPVPSPAPMAPPPPAESAIDRPIRRVSR
jgi:hypothetical protein